MGNGSKVNIFIIKRKRMRGRERQKERVIRRGECHPNLGFETETENMYKIIPKRQIEESFKMNGNEKIFVIKNVNLMDIE